MSASSLNFLKAFVTMMDLHVGTDQDVNSSSDTYVTWSWRAGGSKNTFNDDDVGYASAAAAGLTGGRYYSYWCISWNKTRI